RNTQLGCGVLSEREARGATHGATASNTGFTGRLTNGGQHRAHVGRQRRDIREMKWEHVPLLYILGLEKATSHPLVWHIDWRVGRLTTL
ncbi:hypothetical protein CORC01_08578, partial [Colletotrichum orchidophilum]